MKPLHRKLALLLALAVVVTLAWFAPEPAEVARPVRERGAVVSSVNTASTGPARSAQAPAPASEGTLAPTLPERESLGRSAGNLFGTQSWEPPPPKAVPPSPPPPPPPPVAPPNPYRFAGRLTQGGEVKVFLTKGDAPVQVKVGELLDGVYRIDEISSGSISMTYTPLQLRETIPIVTGTDVAGGISQPGAMLPPSAGVLAFPKPLVLAPRPPGVAPVVPDPTLRSATP